MATHIRFPDSNDNTEEESEVRSQRSEEEAEGSEPEGEESEPGSEFEPEAQESAPSADNDEEAEDDGDEEEEGGGGGGGHGDDDDDGDGGGDNGDGGNGGNGGGGEDRHWQVASIPHTGHTAYLMDICGNRTMRGVNWRQPPIAAVPLEPDSLLADWDWDPVDLIAFATGLTDLTVAVFVARETNVAANRARAKRMWWQLAQGSAYIFVPLGGLDH
ncbi:hypothetical protein HDU88_005727, partial [Geranomyces variabilis]